MSIGPTVDRTGLTDNRRGSIDTCRQRTGRRLLGTAWKVDSDASVRLRVPARRSRSWPGTRDPACGRVSDEPSARSRGPLLRHRRKRSRPRSRPMPCSTTSGRPGSRSRGNPSSRSTTAPSPTCTEHLLRHQERDVHARRIAIADQTSPASTPPWPSCCRTYGQGHEADGARATLKRFDDAGWLRRRRRTRTPRVHRREDPTLAILDGAWAPGNFVYSDAGAHLVSAILATATVRRAGLRERDCSTLDIESEPAAEPGPVVPGDERRIQPPGVDSRASTSASGRASPSAADLAKIGNLYLETAPGTFARRSSRRRRSTRRTRRACGCPALRDRRPATATSGGRRTTATSAMARSGTADSGPASPPTRSLSWWSSPMRCRRPGQRHLALQVAQRQRNSLAGMAEESAIRDRSPDDLEAVAAPPRSSARSPQAIARPSPSPRRRTSEAGSRPRRRAHQPTGRGERHELRGEVPRIRKACGPTAAGR